MGYLREITSVLRDGGVTCAAAVLSVLALLAAGPSAFADNAAGTTVKSQHGFWQVICKTPEGSKNELCVLVQDVTSDSNPDVQLSVQFHQSPEGKKVLRVHAPLGILLPQGLGLQIDKETVGSAPFVRCQQVVGCVAQVTLPPDILDKFKKGKTAWFVIYQTKEQGIGIPVALDGLADGLNEIDGAAPQASSAAPAAGTAAAPAQ
jgi:invasion protein IalB